ncbi:MAG TPA: hypothetical protein VIY47_08935 [Ignavibacteriaceae bacterium]
MLKPKHALGAWKGYAAVKNTVGAIAHPVTWVRDQIRDMIISAAVKIAVAIVGEKVANIAKEKIGDVAKDIDFSVPIPEKLRKSFIEDGETDKILVGLANDAMAMPLAMLGFKVGEIKAERNEDSSELKFRLKLQVSKA